jgi:hypothetical protein
MRKVLILLGIISALSLVGALAGSGLSVPGTASSTAPPPTPLTVGTPSASQLAAIAIPTPATALLTPAPLPARSIVTTHEALVLLNPSSARPGSTIGVTGSGFDAGTTVDIYLKHSPDDTGKNLGFIQADKSGSFGGFNLTLPADFASGPFIVVVQQHNSAKQAMATGTVAANSPVVTFGTQVGKSGDVIAYSLKGFAPGEKVNIYFNSLSSPRLATVVTGPAGDLRQDNLTVPFGAIGNNSFIFVGQKSQSPVTVTFLMLNLYPTLSVNTYATRADSTLAFSGKGFGPAERVFIHLNSVQSPPIAIAKADASGVFKSGALFTLPYALKGKSTFIAIGEQSDAPATVSVDVLPYTPAAETSTYGGRAGTTVTFYGTGFGRDELVHVYAGRTALSQGEEVSCFRSDTQGNFGAAGSYTISSGTQPGQLSFTLIGQSSDAPALAKMQVMAPSANEPAPPAVAPKPFHCPLNGQLASVALPTPTPVPPPPPGPAAANPTQKQNP